MAEGGTKLTLRRLEAPVHKFIKVALPTDLERLQKHHSNILKYQQGQQWGRLHQEHINASRTVQQLRANIREMEKLCSRVRAEDAPALERLVKPVKDRASAAARDFLQLHANPALQPTLPPSPPPDSPRSTGCGRAGDDFEEDFVSGWQIHSQLPEIPVDESAAESWENLEEDLKQLNGLATSFSVLVHAAGYKMAILPLAGALLGGALAGPLGLLIGLKTAGAAAVGGGALGFAGGSLVKHHRKNLLALQMKQLTAPPAHGKDE
ncbi:syntaxin-17 isoform X2 [Syngnathoides biaculeatus]|uniref:syntaxin-17 isoform X2 n=1 Tax=Syngnathoides biaculeatus TaxID=300417 RepID=UPI002ADDD34B|nr:syntaxin-17 isoform X2 [Syngnathoides biaculeatus]